MEIEYKGVEGRKGVRTRVRSRASGKTLEYHLINAIRLYLKMFTNNAASYSVPRRRHTNLNGHNSDILVRIHGTGVS